MSEFRFPNTCRRRSSLALVVLLFHLLAGGEAAGSHQPIAGDREILLAVAASNEWSGLPQLKSWNLSLAPDHCTWIGVTCAAGGGGVVTELALPHLSLAGTVPASVCALKNLTRLDLSYNNLTGAFPAAALYACVELRFLDLSNNLFSGHLPRDIDRLSPAMERLNLSTNSFAGEVPAAVARLTALKSLLLHTNRFTGAYPAVGISELDGLQVLTLGGNAFAPGTVPAEFAKLTNLTFLWMDGMNLAGEIPEAFSSLTELKVLSLASNKLTGTIPAWVLQHEKLQRIYLFDNSLSGELQRNVTAVNLVELDASSNKLTGEIPEGFGKLKNLGLLFLQKNQLTGAIPSDISSLIKKLNLSSNQLTGEVPAQLQVAAYGRSYLGNPGLCARAGSGLNLPTCRGVSGAGHVKLSRGKIILFAGIALVGSISIACWLLCRRRREAQKVKCWKMTSYSQFSFSKAEVLTKLQDENMIGRGGSGRVYRMHVRTRNAARKMIWNSRRTVAVKRICGSGERTEKEFDAEIKVLASKRHENIVELLCSMHSEQEKLVVLEHMDNGSLDRWLHHREGALTTPLDWPTRLSIAIDAARGLYHLHDDSDSSPIVHRDVKSKNILLDQKFRAKIADFGLSVFLAAPGQSVLVSTPAGTSGYMAPEILRRPTVDEKVDVYSFGVLLLELISAKAPDGGDTDIGLAEWGSRVWQHCQNGARFEDAVDEAIRSDDPVYMKQIRRVFIVGLCCTMNDPHTRPLMSQVLQQLITCQQQII